MSKRRVISGQTTNSPPNDLPLIRASELTQYSFCHRAWWLGIVKKIPADNQATLTRGREAHVHHGRRVGAVVRWRQMGWLFIGTGSLLLLVLFWRLCSGFLL